MLNLAGMALDGLPAWADAILDTLSFFSSLFLTIVINAVPFLLLGALGSGLIEVFFEPREISAWFPRQPLLSAFTGSFLGFFFPAGESGSIPLSRRLMQKGAPVSTGVSMLLAAPAFNPIVIASTLAAFGPGLVFWGRFGLTLLIATLVGWIFSLHPEPRLLMNQNALAQMPKYEALPDRQPFLVRLSQALLILVDEFFEMGSGLVLGALLAAFLQTVVRQPALLDLGQGPVLSVVVMIALAVLRSVSSIDDSFIALPLAGSFPGAVLAFLVFGSMLDIKSIWMLFRVFTFRTIAYMAALVLLMTLIGTVFINYFGQGRIF